MKKVFNDSRILKLLMLCLVLTFVFSFGIMQIIASSVPVPGSNQDPIVTKSYVDKAIADALKNVNITASTTPTQTGSTSTTDLTALQKQISDLEKTLQRLQSEMTYSSVSVSGELQKARFNLVQLYKGQRLILGEGAEMILRAGIANAVSGPGGDMSNLTSGQNVTDNSKIDANNLILSARDDGRGLLVISDTIWVMVKGSYKVQ